MIIGPPKAIDTKITIKVDDEEIVPAQQLKLLGIITVEQVNLSEHIREMSTKASQRLGVLKRLKMTI